MRRHRLAALFALAALLAVPDAGAGEFFAAFRDLPLMPGLTEQQEAAVVFDHATGQVATAVASGPVEPAAVRRFYRLSLPPLGWEPECAQPSCAPPDRYRRDGEVLELELASGPEETAVRIVLTRQLSNLQ
ncbi:MAG: hypothetical protein OXI22_20825 [Defluviicoccus sp.]|nr:hypothetical protein [Defluviicoccus sp.]MDE0386338.1 hypothetical protein [Defluviicoccus sp.]